MSEIRVFVIRRSQRPYWEAQWVDPVTGGKRRRSTGTATKRDAERFAAKLEKDLNEGRLSEYKTTWEDFRIRYESEVGASLSEGSASKISTAFNTVEERLAPKYLRSVDAGELSKMSAAMRADGLAEATIASRLRHIKAALRWAARMNLIAQAPHITMPAKANEKAGGRAPTPEEFDRMLSAVAKLVKDPVDAESWRHLLRGLWWSGLRITEAFRLHWVDDRHITVDLVGRRPMFCIKAESNKNRKTQRFPMAPEFHEMLSSTQEGRRDGFVFCPTIGGERVKRDRVIRTIAKIGEKAGVVVGRDTEDHPVYASAHDLRRSFGTRWAKRVMPPVLKLLMRHSAIQTTLTFYVDQNADEAADALWDSIAKESPGTTLGTTAQNQTIDN